MEQYALFAQNHNLTKYYIQNHQRVKGLNLREGMPGQIGWLLKKVILVLF